MLSIEEEAVSRLYKRISAKYQMRWAMFNATSDSGYSPLTAKTSSLRYTHIVFKRNRDALEVLEHINSGKASLPMTVKLAVRFRRKRLYDRRITLMYHVRID